MRRRFGRRRRGGSEDRRGAAIDPGLLDRLVEAHVLPVAALRAVTAEGVPEGFCLVAEGDAEDGSRWLVGVSPSEGGDALFGVLGLAAERPGFDGHAAAVAPAWSASARRRLSLLGPVGFPVHAFVAPELGAAEVAPELPPEPVGLPLARVAAHLARPSDRDFFLRVAASLEGLAAKHDGSVRSVGRAVELVVAAGRVATLRADESGVLLETEEDRRTSLRLGPENVADAMDRLEGAVRKRLHDREIRDGEEGFRTRGIAAVAAAAELRALVRWPLGGVRGAELDFAAVAADGVPVLGALRREITLPLLATLCDALLEASSSVPALLAAAEPPVRLSAPRLVLAGERFAPAARRVLAQLALDHTLVEVRAGARGVEALRLPAGPAPATAERRPPPLERTAPAFREPRPTASEPAPAPRPAFVARPAAPEAPPRPAPPSAEPEPSGRRPEERAPRPAEPAPSRFLEVSLFDLEDEVATSEPAAADSDEGGRRRRRSRRGRGRRRGPPPAEAGSGTPGAPATGSGGEGPGREEREPRRERPLPERVVRERVTTDDELDVSEDLAPLAEAPELELPSAPRYEDEEEEEVDAEQDRLHLERERRRRARIAKMEPEPAPEPKRQRPRRRAAVLAHADRDSVAAAMLLARDLRLLEGIWVYPQTELMTFFRSVATDLREDTPIYIVGFTASPARDTIQAAALYRDRLVWFDHHVWPPEDLEGLRRAIGPGAIHLTPGSGSVLPTVLAECTRRSRFSDKLVDMMTGRFTVHDFERWGRLWRWRLEEIASRPGEHRAALEPLLVGRPSDLTKEAARVPVPPSPPELDFVASRDFRLVRFGGHALVVIEVPPPLDPNLAARIARERYGAQISLAAIPGDDVVLLGAEEIQGRRPLDLGGMVDHLAKKFGFVTAGPDEDHVPRFRIERRAQNPERLDEVIGEIAMGRSTLEG